MKKEILLLFSIFAVVISIPSAYAAIATMEGNNWTNIDNILDSLGFAFLKNNSASFADLQQNDTSDRNYLNLTFPTYSSANSTYLFKLNATTCVGTDKSQWNGTNFICSPDQNSGGTGEVGTSTTNQMNLSSSSNASFANYSITLLQSLFNLQNLTNIYFNNTKLNKTGDTMSGILIISGWLNDSSGNAYLKNTTVLCGANMTCTQNINGSITLSSTGGSGSESGGIGLSTTDQMNLSSASNSTFANNSILSINLTYGRNDSIINQTLQYNSSIFETKFNNINNTFALQDINNTNFNLSITSLQINDTTDRVYVNNTFVSTLTTNQMNISSASNASFANYSITILNLLFDFTNMTKLNKTDVIPISNITYLQQKLDFVNNTFVNTSNNTYVQTNNMSYVQTNNISYVLTNNLTYYNKADATYVNSTYISSFTTNQMNLSSYNNRTYFQALFDLQNLTNAYFNLTFQNQAVNNTNFNTTLSSLQNQIQGNATYTNDTFSKQDINNSNFNATFAYKTNFSTCVGGEYSRWNGTGTQCFADLGGTNLTYTFVIRTDGVGNYYAKGTNTGQDDYSGVNFSTVLNSSINDVQCVSGCTILIRAGHYIMNDTVIIRRNSINIVGEGYGTNISLNNETMNGFEIGIGNANSAPIYNTLQNFRISSNVGNQVSGSMILLNSTRITYLKQLELEYGHVGIDMNDSIITYVAESTIQYLNASTGIGIRINGSYDGSNNDQYIERVTIDNGALPEPLYGIQIINTGAFEIHFANVINAGTGLAITPTGNKHVKYGFVSQSAFDSNNNDGIDINPTSGGSAHSINFVDTWSASNGKNGLNIRSSSANLSNIRFTFGRLYNNQWHGAFIQSNGDIRIHDSTITGNSQASVAGYDGIRVGANIEGFSIKNNRIGATEFFSSRQNWGINILSGTSNNYSITGNDLLNNLANNNTNGLFDGGTGNNKYIFDNIGDKRNVFGTNIVDTNRGVYVGVGNTYISYAGNTVSAFGYNSYYNDTNIVVVPDSGHTSSFFYAGSASLRGMSSISNGNTSMNLNFYSSNTGRNLTVYGQGVSRTAGTTKSSGITLYDETGAARCVQVYSNGSVGSVTGACL